MHFSRGIALGMALVFGFREACPLLPLEPASHRPFHFSTQALAATAAFFSPKARGLQRNPLSMWSHWKRYRVLREQRLPNVLIQRYPKDRRILAELVLSPLVSTSSQLEEIYIGDPALFERTLSFLRQNPRRFFHALKIFAPSPNGLGISWTAGKIGRAFIAFPVLLVSSIQLASAYADDLRASGHLNEARVDLDRLLAHHEIQLTFSNPGEEAALRHFKSFLALLNMRPEVSTKARQRPEIHLAVVFQGDMFSLSTDGATLTVPEDLADRRQHAATLPERQDTDRTLEILAFSTQLAVATAILRQKTNEPADMISEVSKTTSFALFTGFGFLTLFPAIFGHLFKSKLMAPSKVGSRAATLLFLTKTIADSRFPLPNRRVALLELVQFLKKPIRAKEGKAVGYAVNTLLDLLGTDVSVEMRKEVHLALDQLLSHLTIAMAAYIHAEPQTNRNVIEKYMNRQPATAA